MKEATHLTGMNEGLFNADYSPFVLITQMVPWKHGETGVQIYEHRIVDVRKAPPHGFVGALMVSGEQSANEDGGVNLRINEKENEEWCHGMQMTEGPNPPDYMVERLAGLNKGYWNQ